MREITVKAEEDIDKTKLNSNTISFEERAEQLKKQEEFEKEELEKRKKSPYENWVQVNKDFYKAEDWLMSKSPIAYRIFKFLINNMDGYNSVICSQLVLQEVFNVSRPTVGRAIKLLKEKKYIDIYKSGTSNIYCVNKNIAWTSWGSNFKYAKFGANIIISQNEQEHIDFSTTKLKQVNIKE